MLVLLGFVAVVLAVGAIGAWSSISAVDQYKDLRGPPWAPPSLVFGPVWSILYVLIAVAGWLAWRAGAGWRDPAMGFYGAQLVLNGLWTPLFFAWQMRGAAFLCIIALDLVVGATMWLFWKRSRVAAGLLAPYMIWILFASALNFAYWTMNR